MRREENDGGEHIYVVVVTIADMGDRSSRFEGGEEDGASPPLYRTGGDIFRGL